MDLDRASDARLLAAHVPGVAGPAFASFYRRYERPILAFHLRRSRDAETAADLTAETFVEALESRHRFCVPDGTRDEGAAGWLFGIAGHVYSRHARRSAAEARRHALVAVLEGGLTDQQHVEIAALAESGPLLDALATLPDAQREAVRAYVLDDRSYGEIASALAVEPATVRKRVSRGLAALRAATKEAR